MTRRQSAQLGLGFAISILFLWLILRSIPARDIFAALATVDAGWMALAVAFFAAGYACRIERWRRMLLLHRPGIGWRRCAVPFMASIAANNVLPFRAGDALRAVAFSGWLDVPTARVLATLLAERLMDLLALLLALALALALLGGGAGFGSLLTWSTGLFGLATVLVVLLLFPRALEPPMAWLLRAVSRFAPGVARAAGLQIERVFDTLQGLASPRHASTLLVWSLLAWGFEGSMFYAVARALPGIVQPIAAWLAMPVGTLSTMLPSTPGYVGTFHFFAMRAMEELGNPEAASAAFAFLVHFTLYVPVTLIGGICFGYWMLVRASIAPAPLNKALLNDNN